MTGTQTAPELAQGTAESVGMSAERLERVKAFVGQAVSDGKFRTRAIRKN